MFIDINAAGCPNTCRHCSVGGHLPHGAWFSLQELRTIQAEWGSLTIRYEPTAHPDFPEIYQPDIAVEYGGWLVTNGFGLAQREDYRQVLAKMHTMQFTTASFTLHGSQEHHDWFACRPGAYADILTATRRLRAEGFQTLWQVFVDRTMYTDLPKLIETALRETGEVPALEIPYHRVGGRLRWYESIRPVLNDVDAYHLDDRLLNDAHNNIFLRAETLTAQHWLAKWQADPDATGFRHPFEPPDWPSKMSHDMLSLRIERSRRVFFDPLCAPPIALGQLSDGKDALLERLQNSPMPTFADMDPQEVHLPENARDRLHPSGFSVRYVEISKQRF